MKTGVTGPFKGAVPAISEKLLPAGFAAQAINCDLRTGKLAPLTDTLRVMEIPKAGDIRTIFKLDDTWLYWTSYVDVVRSQIAGTSRIFYTGDGYPKQTNKTLATSGADSTYPTTHQRLGVVAPDAGLTLTTGLIDAGGSYGDVLVSTAWCYTRVSTFDSVEDESAPSPPTSINSIDIRENEGATLTGFTVGDAGNNVTAYRIYRLATGDSGETDWQLVPWSTDLDGNPIYDMPVSETSFSDADTGLNTIKQDLGRVCPSQTWACPPDALSGLSQFQNGIIAGFVENQPYISDIFIPYGYPEDYREGMAMGEAIVALGMFRDQMIVVNGAEPWVIGGSDPEYLQKMEIPISQACLSARGLIKMPDRGIVYPSPDGLVLTDGTGGTVLTKAIWTKVQWEALSPETLIGAYYDGKYYGFFEGTGTGFILDLNDAHVVMVDLGDRDVYGLHVVPADDTLYLLVKDGDAYFIEAWEGGTGALTYTYTLPVVESEHLNFGCGEFLGASGTVTLLLVADGETRFNSSVTLNEIFRLPGGYTGKVWQVTVTGTVRIDTLQIAEDISEL